MPPEYPHLDLLSLKLNLYAPGIQVKHLPTSVFVGLFFLGGIPTWPLSELVWVPFLDEIWDLVLFELNGWVSLPSIKDRGCY